MIILLNRLGLFVKKYFYRILRKMEKIKKPRSQKQIENTKRLVEKNRLKNKKNQELMLNLLEKKN